MTSLQRVLIANRGEIALRIAEAAAGLGLETVAVFPAADRDSRHVRAATEARELAGADPVAAYLDADALVAVALETGCDAVHPGYGFLSEQADFARRCADAGLMFVGPDVEALALFGDKVRSRAFAEARDVPVIPGAGAVLDSLADAARAADAAGYPVMLKAAAGGGGRGLRAVHHPDDLAEAYDRCRSEAQAAFGRADVFLEKLLVRPRHVEVQILGDGTGRVVHLHDRDCSVQVRNQKVIEIAPAPALDAPLRERLLDDAVRLAAAAGYVNAGTMEFLVSPETGEHFFIEGNARIQVEHTVTEQVTGVDLVQAQFRIAAGATLADLGLPDQAAVGHPRGVAVQARLVATAPGTLTAYQEPTGANVRVDGAGYVGYSPPPAFDPLLAKIIGWGPDVAAAVERTARAVDTFQLAGLPTNLGGLHALLTSAEVRSGDARTTLTTDRPELLATERDDGPTPAVPAAGATPEPRRSELVVGVGEIAVRAPGAATVQEVRVAPGDVVAAGAVLVVCSAMKMETTIAAPCSGTVVAIASLAAGATVGRDEVVVVVAPASDDTGEVRVTATDPADTWQPMLDDVAALQGIAHTRLAPGSDDPGVVRQRDRGKLTCRERLALLFDADTFREVGSLAGFTSYDADGGIAAFTPASHVGGWGQVEGRTVVACADDFTSRGGHADGAIAAKSLYLDALSMELRCPSVRLLDGSSGGGSVAAMVPQQQAAGSSSAQESRGHIEAGKPRVAGGGGSFLPGHLGSTEYAEQLATVPVVNVLLGSVVGIGAAKAVLGHFSVMVRDIAQLFVAGPPVVSHAMGYDISKEELGDWRVHATNGSVDNLAETEEDAIAQTKRFLSYLPANVHEQPPVIACDDPLDRRDEQLSTIVPRKRTATFDVRRVIELVTDRGSFFEIGPQWGTDQVVGLARVGGYPIGVIASDSRHENGGALTADGCDKLTRHLDLCDLFHLPVLNLVDNPGFAVGLEHERAGTIRKGGTWMIAFAQTEVPLFTVLLRRSFGVAGNNYATPRRAPSVRVAWPAADVGGIPPEGGIEAAYKRQLAEAADPVALRAELNARIESARGPIGPLNKFQLEEMIDPRDTRRLLAEWVPTAHRLATSPDRLRPRPLRFRP